MIARRLLATVLSLTLTAGSAFAQDRSQTFLISQSEAHSKGADFFNSIRTKARDKGVLVESGARHQRVVEVAKRLRLSAGEYRPDAESWGWEVILIDERVNNAFCLPGGKIALYTGLIDDLELTDDELASLLGHEMAHAVREHSREKQSKRAIANVAVGILAIAAGIYGAKHRVDPGAAMDLTRLGGSLGASLFFLLPHSREMELEADAIGAELAARAGFNPEAAQSLWRKMSLKSSGRAEFLSTHPSPETRINELGQAVQVSMQRFADRRAAARPVVVDAGASERPATAVSGVAMVAICELPDGNVESLGILACTRLGGNLKEVVK